jgi:hypothetical protein
MTYNVRVCTLYDVQMVRTCTLYLYILYRWNPLCIINDYFSGFSASHISCDCSFSDHLLRFIIPLYSIPSHTNSQTNILKQPSEKSCGLPPPHTMETVCHGQGRRCSVIRGLQMHHQKLKKTVILTKSKPYRHPT